MVPYYHIWTYNPRFYSLLLGIKGGMVTSELDSKLAQMHDVEAKPLDFDTFCQFFEHNLMKP